MAVASSTSWIVIDLGIALSGDPCDPEATRMDIYLDQFSRVVKAHDLSFLRYVSST
ncbi:MAG: hypothetical protein OEU26_17115 [Candidatus Tectomicrobia bacterium]|nr:hypothetical protein [Candidatus Tectomicrobia bacterium]